MSGGHGLTRLTVNYLDRVSSKSECKRTTWTFVDKFLPNDLYLNYKEKLDVDHPLYSVFLFSRNSSRCVLLVLDSIHDRSRVECILRDFGNTSCSPSYFHHCLQ